MKKQQFFPPQQQSPTDKRAEQKLKEKINQDARHSPVQQDQAAPRR